MNIYQFIGEITVTVFIITMVVLLVIKVLNTSRLRLNRKINSKSSFVLNTKDKNIEEKYKNLDIRGFDTIGGLAEIKEELKKYVKCFDSKSKFKEQNVTIPRGILLWGPPGCGKTSLAKAIAYEAHINFICRNASDLIDSTFGIRDRVSSIEKLFDEARNLAPCILFIDELDVIGSRYDPMGNAGMHQVEVTRFLAEMDGFQNNDDIMVIAATNNQDMLDKALLRSGRFGKKYYVGPPTSKADVVQIVNMYTKGKNFDQEVTEDVLTSLFRGYSPADIKAILNECGVHSILNDVVINIDMIRKAIIELDISTSVGNTNNLSEERRKEAAKHEAGHAIVGKALGISIQSVTLLGANNGTRGITKASSGFSDEDSDNSKFTDETIQGVLNQITMAYGGVAVELAEGKTHEQISLGCTGDLITIGGIMSSLVKSTTFTEKALVNTVSLQEKPDKFFNIIIEVLKKLEDKAVDIIKENSDVLNTLANELMDKITLADDELEEILKDVKPWEDTKTIK